MAAFRWRRRALLAACLAFGAGARAADVRVIELRIAAGAVDPTLRAVRVRKGDEVALRVTADEAGSLHLHGYGIALELSPGVLSEARFVARATGRFAIHFHRTGEKAAGHRHGPPLATLDVLPP
jgi:hypothetical protein